MKNVFFRPQLEGISWSLFRSLRCGLEREITSEKTSCSCLSRGSAMAWFVPLSIPTPSLQLVLCITYFNVFISPCWSAMMLVVTICCQQWQALNQIPCSDAKPQSRSLWWLVWSVGEKSLQSSLRSWSWVHSKQKGKRDRFTFWKLPQSSTPQFQNQAARKLQVTHWC